MADKLAEVFEAYDMEVLKTGRGRDSTILYTDKGVRQLRRLLVGEGRLSTEKDFKEQLFAQGFCNIDLCVPNVDEELYTCDRYGTPFVLREYIDGQEINPSDKEHIKLAVINLANFHIAGRNVFLQTEKDVHVRDSFVFRKRNKELKRVYSFIIKKHQKKQFEQAFVDAFAYYYKQAMECEREGVFYEPNDERIGFCHGMYNQHSVLLGERDGEKVVFTTSLDKFYVGNQLTDLYYFLRKAVEKNNYSFEIVQFILDTYSSVSKLNNKDIEYIYRLFAYPEKYYKLGNQYMSAGKNWISPKMIEKMTKIIEDETSKSEILLKLKQLFSSHL